MSTVRRNPMRRSAAETRSHVLRTAGERFYWKGIRATGVDQVAADAGVAPTTLYRLFASKDDLVGAYVERTDHEGRERFDRAVDEAGPDPRDQILAVFDAALSRIRSGESRGCPMHMTLAEFPDPDLPAHRNAVRAKAWGLGRLGELTARLGVAEPDVLAAELMVILEGVHAAGQSLGAEGPAKYGRRLAEAALAAAGERR
jgi:AcrR family transcriptional regulator